MKVREHIVREVKVETLRRIVAECDLDGLPARKDRLISFAASEWGTEKRKALEYLNQLMSEEAVFIDCNDVWIFERWKKIVQAKRKDYLLMEDIIKGYIQKKI